MNEIIPNEIAMSWWVLLTYEEQLKMLHKHRQKEISYRNIQLMWNHEHGNYPR